MEKSEATVAAYYEETEALYEKFTGEMSARIERVNQLRDRAMELRTMHCPELCSYKSTLQLGAAAAAASASSSTRGSGELPPSATAAATTGGADGGSNGNGNTSPATAPLSPSVVPALDPTSVQPPCTYSEKAIEFPDNKELVKQYDLLGQEAQDAAYHLAHVKVYISMNLPDVMDWNSQEVQNMTALLAAIQEVNDNDLALCDTSMVKYLAQRRQLEEKAFDLPLHTVSQMILAFDVGAWDHIEILYRSFSDIMIQLYTLLVENKALAQGARFKKGRHAAHYA